ncbi:hypothetical protein F5Y16DRAFT_403464 [Xylariaceae sp. FL0255]|nr:hypothetical protein F5Y16DRAFT_403464 [Xylariaceae sp. FL0255]
MEDVLGAVSSILTEYESQRTHQKIIKWLRSFANRVQVYGNVMDVLVQQHPEYVSLVWGAMKFLFTAVINHEKIATTLAKALTQLADTLPRVEVASILYPTERLKTAVVQLNIQILEFLSRAYTWYRENSFKRILHSITQPVELRYQDLLESMTTSSDVVRLVAECSQQVELRDVHHKINHMNTSFEEKLNEIERRLEVVSVDINSQLSATINTSTRLSDIQLSHILQSIFHPDMKDPMKALQNLRVGCLRGATNPFPLLSRNFLNSPKLRNWASSAKPDILIIKGNFRSRQALRTLCVDIIDQLNDAQILVLFAIKTNGDKWSQGGITTSSVLRYLLWQALSPRQPGHTEKSLSLRCAQFHGLTTETQYLEMLGSLLSTFDRPVYIILDLEILSRESLPSERFNWLTAFLSSFEKLSNKHPTTQVKVLLLSYKSEFPFVLRENESSRFLLRAKEDRSTAHQRNARRHVSNKQRHRLPILKGHGSNAGLGTLL